MAIDVRNITGRISGTGSKQSVSNEKSKRSENSASTSKLSDSLLLTDTASTLQRAEQLLSAIPIVNSTEVSEISESLSNGNYEVDSEHVAEKIIRMEQSLPS